MYVSSLLLSKANKGLFQFDRLGAVFQRRQGTDFTPLYFTFQWHCEAKSRSWQVLSTLGRNWPQKKMFVWVKTTYLEALQKCCFPVKIKQPSVSSLLSQPKKSCDKAFSWVKIQWSLCLVGFMLLSACFCRSPAPSPTQAGTQSSLPLPSGLVLLFLQASAIQLLQEIKNFLLLEQDLVQPESSFTCKAYLEQNTSLSRLTRCKCTQAATVLRYLKIYIFLSVPSALISAGAGCLICLCTSENPIKCLFTSLGA